MNISTTKVVEAVRRAGATAIGSGPPLVVIHGGPGMEHSYLQTWLRPLQSQRTLVFYDQIGSHDLGTSNTNVSMLLEQLTDLLNAILSEASSVGVFAHSWGTHLGLCSLAGVRSKIDELVLCNPFPLTAERFNESGARLIAKVPPDVLKLVGELETQARPDAGLDLMRSILPYYLGSEGRHVVDELDFKAYSISCNGAVISSLGDFDIRAMSELCPAKTLLMYGSEDFLRPSDTKELHSRSSVIEFSGTGHFPFAEKKQEFTSAVTAFLSDK